MVDASAIKFYRSAKGGQSLGYEPTSTQIISATPNNLFTNVTRTEQVAGEDYYLCMYLKNTSAETIKNVSFWESSGTPGGDTSVKWAFENNFTAGVNVYDEHPNESFNGTSDFVEGTDIDITSSFSVSAWFRTSTEFGEDKAIVVKGKFGSETAADNLNYALYMNSSEQVIGGFEEADGTNHVVTSASSYNDGLWHHACVVYDKVAGVVTLYIDGASVGTPDSTTTTPNTNSHNLSIGWGRAVGASYFEGDIDEVRVWSDDLTASQVADLHSHGTISQTDDLEYENKFGNNNNSKLAQGIADIYTAPTGLTWNGSGGKPAQPNIGTLGPGAFIPIWIWWHVEAGAGDVTNDKAIFGFSLDTSTTGTGSSGGGSTGGTGGNPQPTVTDWKIAMSADWGVTDDTQDVVNLIDDIGHQLVIGGGDNSYDDGSAADFWDMMQPIDDNQGSSCRWEGAMGNHEYEEDDPVSAYTNHLKISKTFYSFDFKNVHVLILDTNLGSFDDTQKTFATDDLTKANNNSTIDWIFVCFHHPACGASSKHPNNEYNQIEEYFDMFRSKGVNLILTGHNHNVQRTYPIKRSGSSVAKVINSTGPYTVGSPENWMIHVISGAGGHDGPGSLYSLGSKPSFQVYQSNDYNGILSIQASNNGQTLTCKFIDTSGATKHSWVMVHNN